MDYKKPKYIISVASEILGLHPQTLRQYERMGLVIPARLDGKNRLYSEEDMEKLRYITALTKNMGVNLAGVAIIMDMRDKISMLTEQISVMEAKISLKYGENISLNEESREIKKIKIEK
ncbi:MAG: helix-turn-helix transcriptional regulator, partial [Mucispirillum sp.]|nr:helix-turn-helix transcriptional regulator [Mucispirillum sp.]